MAGENPKLKEAQEKLNAFLHGAGDLGMTEYEICKKVSAIGLGHHCKPSIRKMIVYSVLCLFTMGIYMLNIHQAAVNVYYDWKYNAVNSRQCAVPTPESFSGYFRPPADCQFCRDVEEVEKVKEVSATIFEERYAYSGRPVVVSDGTANWTAPSVFSLKFFKSLYAEKLKTPWNSKCQFFPYHTKFQHLGQFLKITEEELYRNSPWYVGWSNCDVEITNALREHYNRPYFLPPDSEGKRLDWIFMGSTGFGAPMHVDNVEYPSWQAQLTGRKKWRLQPPPECFYQCQSLEVIVEPGDIIVLDTNQWYHQTLIESEEISITIGAEFD